ncbi:MAG: FAD-binding protein [Lentisphaerae bacterium]|nr:FAD-binding protein [Lentisphaerota bacterium]
MTTVHDHALEKALRWEIHGEVSFDPHVLGLYATDASSYQIQPIGLVVPRNEDDVAAAMRIAAEYGVAVLPRGGGTSLSGQTVARALVLDFSKYMNGVLELNVAERRVRVQPGLVRDELNALLAPHGLHFAPDPATTSRANVGGMIANNASGMRSLLYGKTVDHVLGLTVLLADGTRLTLGPLTPTAYDFKALQSTREGRIHRGLRDIIQTHRDEIRTRFPKVMRRVGGYNLDAFVDHEHWNLSKLICGSEGTLAVILDATLNLEPLPRHTALCVAHFHDLLGSIRAVESILAHKPSAVELLDRIVLRMARGNRATAAQAGFIAGDPAAALIVEFYADSAEEAARRVQAVADDLRSRGMGYAYPVMTEAGSQANVWAVRKSGLGLMLGIKGDRKPIPFIEDACVPVAVLPEYIDRVIKICHAHDTNVTMYAHASVGLLHVRPVLDLRQAADIARMKSIADQTLALVMEYGGSWSGEHGDGLVRSPFMERVFGTRLYGAFKEVKQLFDPRGLLNPGKIVDAEPMDHNLRYGTAYRAQPLKTEYHYREDGSFAAAVEMCTGVGQCRKTLTGTMCPSYMVTRDEEHSTRGRANALRLAMTGQLGPDALTSPRLFQTLDLCLSCKSCKTECPSNVDVAKFKGEFLQQYHDKHGATRRERLIAASPALARRLAGALAPVVNAVQASSPARWLIEVALGFSRARHLPAYAREPFPVWFANRPAPALSAFPGARPKVALFGDTYMTCHEPGVGRAAVELLESCGYEVLLADVGCCQRTRISHGFLREAKRDGLVTLQNLDRFVERGIPVVVLEPGCASALVDDLPDLIDDAALAKRIEQNVTMIDVFLAREMAAGRLTCRLESTSPSILLHGHCHQKTLFGTAAMKAILGGLPGVSVKEVDSGCCGMAGSFGYEKEHLALSQAIGERRLFPAVRAAPADTALVACGFSCRHQIQHFTGRRAVHWVELVRVGAPPAR